ncbi:hypothetical protein SAMN05444392_10569 [Seinonella peptonophila]|uniref:Uncharacterized protein n=1 Tax=Seinonella peptonophila TaxID=112248 RepID=A0A1M4XLN0_9BACL|nr:hypothetical protein [Seinonella peptonophila]SHE94474.1 hypothetical protein SAMN05444392_10569 [Seinonella peptonophila]
MGFKDKIKAALFEVATEVHQRQQGTSEEEFLRPGGKDGGKKLDEIAEEDHYGLKEEDGRER